MPPHYPIEMPAVLLAVLPLSVLDFYQHFHVKP
jgi:hypothetical protein